MDLGPTARRVFFFAYLAAQLLLIVTAGSRPDRIFGFQMFNESSALKFDLLRKVQTPGRGQRLRRIPVANGSWQERLRDGSSIQVRFADRVRYAALAEPGRFRHATYGAEAQIFRLRAALEDVASHLPPGGDTRKLGARVELSKNGVLQPPFEIWSQRP